MVTGLESNQREGFIRTPSCRWMIRPLKLAPRAGFEPAHFLINSQAHCRFATSEQLVPPLGIEPRPTD